jgi:6-pyruvoyltetrahydropterin/6-carboxytetrahydropterin synthase
MLIRKLFRFENAHVVRGCSTRRCSHSLHGHSYKVELVLEAHAFDHGQMVYDFGLLKQGPRTLIDAFDHAVAIWAHDDPDYIAACQRFSERWVLLPVSPSAEQFSRVLFVLIDRLLASTAMGNGEADVSLHSVIVHETETGYAQCFRADAANPRMGPIGLDEIEFSAAIRKDWDDPDLLVRLQRGTRIDPFPLSEVHDPQESARRPAANP